MHSRRRSDKLVNQLACYTNNSAEEVLAKALNLYSKALDYQKRGYMVKAVFEKTTTFRMENLSF